MFRLIELAPAQAQRAHRRQAPHFDLVDAQPHRDVPDAHGAHGYTRKPFLETVRVAREELANVRRDAEAAQDAPLKHPRDKFHALRRGPIVRVRSEERQAVHQHRRRAETRIVRGGSPGRHLQDAHGGVLRPRPPLAIDAHDRDVIIKRRRLITTVIRSVALHRAFE